MSLNNHVEIPRKVNPQWNRPFYIERAESKGADAQTNTAEQFTFSDWALEDELETAKEARPEILRLMLQLPWLIAQPPLERVPKVLARTRRVISTVARPARGRLARPTRARVEWTGCSNNDAEHMERAERARRVMM